MPGTLARNNWKKKHSKPLRWLGLRSTSEIMVLKEAETTEQAVYTIHRVTDVVDLGLPAKYWKGHSRGLGLNSFGRGRCDGRRGSSEGGRLQRSLSAATCWLGPAPVCNSHGSTSRWLSTTSIKWLGAGRKWLLHGQVLTGSLNWDVRDWKDLESDLSFDI